MGQIICSFSTRPVYSLLQSMRYDCSCYQSHLGTYGPAFAALGSGGSRGGSGLPPPPPPVLSTCILWKWNNFVSVRPNYLICMGYLRKKCDKITKATPSYENEIIRSQWDLWNNLVLVRPNYFICMGYLKSTTASKPPYLHTNEPPFQKHWIRPSLGYLHLAPLYDTAAEGHGDRSFLQEWHNSGQECVKILEIITVNSCLHYFALTPMWRKSSTFTPLRSRSIFISCMTKTEVHCIHGRGSGGWFLTEKPTACTQI